MRLGVTLSDEALLRAARDDDPVDLVVLRSTFLNPPRAAALRRSAERIRRHHRDVELVPYAWHYLTYERDDGIEVGSSRSLDGDASGFGHFRDSPEVAQAWSITEICREALEATRVVVRTPPSFSPGALSRRRLTRFCEGLGADAPMLIWEPEGLWEPASAAAFAAPLGIEVLAPAFSMTGQVLELGAANWLRITGGKQAKLRASHAETLAYALMDHEHVTVLFEGPQAYANLRSFVRARALLE